MTYLTPELHAIADGIRNGTMPDHEPTWLHVEEPDRDDYMTDAESAWLQRRADDRTTELYGPQV